MYFIRGMLLNFFCYTVYSLYFALFPCFYLCRGFKFQCFRTFGSSTSGFIFLFPILDIIECFLVRYFTIYFIVCTLAYYYFSSSISENSNILECLLVPFLIYYSLLCLLYRFHPCF